MLSCFSCSLSKLFFCLYTSSCEFEFFLLSSSKMLSCFSCSLSKLFFCLYTSSYEVIFSLHLSISETFSSLQSTPPETSSFLHLLLSIKFCSVLTDSPVFVIVKFSFVLFVFKISTSSEFTLFLLARIFSLLWRNGDGFFVGNSSFYKNF